MSKPFPTIIAVVFLFLASFLLGSYAVAQALEVLGFGEKTFTDGVWIIASTQFLALFWRGV